MADHGGIEYHEHDPYCYAGLGNIIKNNVEKRQRRYKRRARPFSFLPSDATDSRTIDDDEFREIVGTNGDGRNTIAIPPHLPSGSECG